MFFFAELTWLKLEIYIFFSDIRMGEKLLLFLCLSFFLAKIFCANSSKAYSLNLEIRKEVQVRRIKA